MSTIIPTNFKIKQDRFIILHGWTNMSRVKQVLGATSNLAEIFNVYPPPKCDRLQRNCLLLVYEDHKYFRGKFLDSDATTKARVLLIDVGYAITTGFINVTLTIRNSSIP